MSKSINVTTIEKACKIFDSQRKPIRKADRKPGQFPYYGASGIADYIDDYVFDGTYLLLSEDGDNLRTQNTPIAFLAEGKFWVNNHAHVLQGKDGNLTNYICYALQIADIKSYISGSTRPKITQADMRRIQLNLPPLPEQKAIAHILGKLDDKIELNRQMNQTLEAMAQALFKSWFVDFDPVLDNALAAG
jgi:type I restriction enzyme S subunit